MVSIFEYIKMKNKTGAAGSGFLNITAVFEYRHIISSKKGSGTI